MTKTRLLLTATTALVATGLLALPASAQPAPAPAPAPAAAPATPPPDCWGLIPGIKCSAQIEAGVSFNPQNAATNWGQLFTDHANQPTLNQMVLGIERDIPKDATSWDYGFKFSGLYGSDARYTHFLGIANYLTSDRYQLDVVEASVSVHAPLLVGLDVKAGLYPTPLGFEYIDPSLNPFYSHSYIFNYGIPLKHTGVLGVLHATDFLDVYGGVDTGVNTTLGSGDNNGAIAGLVGFGFTAVGGNLTGVALSHFGPENPSYIPGTQEGVPNANHYFRYENDANVTYKWNDKLSTTLELNYIKDENPYYNAPEAWGVATYLAYSLTDTVTLNARAEVFRDGKGYYVAWFPGNEDFVNSEYGKSNTAVPGPHTTYGEFTVGATWKPSGLPAPIAGLLIRPELRFDQTVGGGPSAFSPAYNSATGSWYGKSSGNITLASDFILQF